MPEDPFSAEQPKPFDLDRILNLVRRRHMQFLLPLFFGWLFIWTAGWFIPAHYKSTTTILVQQPSLSQNYVTPNISVNLQDRLASLTEQILSRTRLLSIASRLHLYETPNHSLPPDELVKRMRKDITIELVQTSNTKSISGFTVSYSATSPLTAQQVTQELTNLFIQNNQASLQRESQSTTAFLQQQLKEARANLSGHESQVREFEAAHQGSLPAQQAANLQILAGLQSQLQNDEDALNTARQQQVYLQSLIGQYNTLHASSQLANSTPADLDLLNTQLSTMKAQLTDLRTRYTERYPAVQDLEEKIAATTRERDRLVAAFQAASNAPPNSQSSASASAGLAATETNPSVLQLKSQLEAASTQIAFRKRDIDQLQGKIAGYQARLNAQPATAALLASLTQGYEQSQQTYNDLLTKEHNSAMATSMEQIQQGERFSILDPPSLPIAPDSPKRLTISLLGIAFGLALGLLIAGGMEFLDDRLYADKDIENLLPVAVIGEIPQIATEAELRQAKRKVWTGWATAVLIVLLIFVGSAINYKEMSSLPSFHTSPNATRHV